MARDDRVAQLIDLLRDAISSGDDDLAQVVRSDLFKEFGLEMNKGGIASFYANGGKVKIPQLSTDVANITDVYEAIDDPSYVRDTTRIDNLRRGSKVTRKMGYDKIFETFEKKGINRATIKKFKNIPKIADFDNAKDFSNALKKFRETAFKGLTDKQINTIRSSGFLSNYAKDVRSALPDFGKGASRRMINTALNEMYDYVFMTPESAVGVRKPKIQSKIYTQIRETGRNTLNKAQQLNLDYALSQVDKLFKSGNVAKAGKMLAAISTMVAKGVFARVPGIDLLITSEMGSGELPEEGTPEYEELMQSIEQKNQGGMMNIDYMTRPLGYANGGFEDRMERLEREMMDMEMERRQDMATGDPEMERDSTYGTITDDNIINIALQIAREQGNTSDENINLIIDQLSAITPSFEETMRKETGYIVPKGLSSLKEKLDVFLGLRSDPMLRRDVGFERVK